MSTSQLYSILIINRSGGLIYSKLIVQHNVTTNDLLRIASTFHGINAISQYTIKINNVNNNNTHNNNNNTDTTTSTNNNNNKPYTRITPDNNGCIHIIEYDSIRIQCYESITGIKFLLCGNISLSHTVCDKYLYSLYVLYCDYVLKNPFYDLENPIRVEKFDILVKQLIQT